MEQDYPVVRGLKKVKLGKYLMGGGMFLLIVSIIWFPLVFYAFSNTVGATNTPYDVRTELSIGPYEPIHHIGAQNNRIQRLSQENYDHIKSLYPNSNTARTFLSYYSAEDVTAIQLGKNSKSFWSISPPDKSRLIDDLKNSNNICNPCLNIIVSI